MLARARLVSKPRAAAGLLRCSLPIQSSRSYASQPPRQPTPEEVAAGQKSKRNAVVSLLLLGSAGALYVYEKQAEKGKVPSVLTSETFTTRFRTSMGVQETVHKLLSPAECESKLVGQETSSNATLPLSLPTAPSSGKTSIIRYDTSYLESNEPIEDRFASNILSESHITSSLPPDMSRNIKGKGKDLALFSVIDGHSGTATSSLLAKTLHPTVAVSLASLYAGYQPQPLGQLNHTFNTWWNPFSWSWVLKSAQPTPSNVALSLQNAFLLLDSHILNPPLQLLKYLPHSPASGQPNPRPIALPTVEPALSGACALTTVIDQNTEEMWVALTGDCRAVAGWWIPGQNGALGKWRCDVLTEDQMGKNPNEIRRIQSEHPESERDSCISRGRVLGRLEPTRAFGDARYKWTQEQSSQVMEALVPADDSRNRPAPSNSLTPPYVTAQPEVTYRKISRTRDGEELKFVILATDGLWDRITSEEATLLVASYLAHPTHADIHKSALPNLFPHVPSPASITKLYPAEPSVTDATRREGTWAFEGDRNAATHLIRNALAGGDRKVRRELLSVTGKESRWLRDDITTTVIFFGDKTAESETPVVVTSEPFATVVVPESTLA